MNVRKKKLVPRKYPQQERSKATVDAILQAATYILVRDGWAHATTNHIADRAGVNVASLYQYFPNKEAIVAELQRRHAEALGKVMLRLFEEHHGHGLQATVRVMVEAGIAAHAVDPRLHQVLTEELPRLAGADAHHPEAEAQLAAGLRRLLQASGRSAANVDLATWILMTASHDIVHRAVLEQPQAVAAGRLAEELTRLLVGYLRGT